MAHLGANGPTLFSSAAGQTQVVEEVLQNAEQSDEGFSKLLQEQQSTEQAEEDESADEGILNILNTTSVSKNSPRASQENRTHRRGLSVTNAITGLFSGGLRLLSAGTIHQPTGNSYTENTHSSETTDNRMDHPVLTSSASKASKKLVRPSTMDKYSYNTNPQGKPDPYEINVSPEKADVEPAQKNQGLKRKRKDPVTKKQHSTRARLSTSKTAVAAAEKSKEELNNAPAAISKKGQLPVIKRVTRATRSSASEGIIVPSDYSKRPEKVGYQSIRLPRKRTSQPTNISEPMRYEIENSDGDSPNEDSDTPEESPRGVANGIRRSKRPRDSRYKDALEKLGDDELQAGIVPRNSDISANKTREAEVSLSTGVKGKESYGGEDGGDGGSSNDDEDGYGEGQHATVTVDDGISVVIFNRSAKKLQPQVLTPDASNDDPEDSEDGGSSNDNEYGREKQAATVTVDKGISSILLDPRPKKLQPQFLTIDVSSEDSEDSEDSGSSNDDDDDGEEKAATMALDEGISSILLDPSPEKLQPQVLTADASSDDPEDIGHNDNEDGYGKEQAATVTDDLRDGSEDSEDGASHRVENLNENSRDSGQLPSESSHFGKNFVTRSKIREMVGHVEKIGRDKDGRLQIKKKKLEICITTDGRRIGELTKLIIADYAAIQEQKANDVFDVTMGNLLSSMAKRIDALEERVRSMVEKRLGDPKDLAIGDNKKDAKIRKRALEDLYMRTMPGLVHALHAAIIAYGEEERPSTGNLKEILRYKSLFTYLLGIAENSHNTSHRPGLEINNKYPILKPYRSLKPLLQGFYQLCMEELKSREQRAETKRLAPELAKKRKKQAEAARLEEEAFQLRRQKQDAKGRATFNQMRMKLGLPPLAWESTRNKQSSQLLQPTKAQKLSGSNTMNRQGADTAGTEDFDTISTDGEFPASDRQTQELSITERRIRAEREANALAMELKEAESLVKKLRREEQLLLQGNGSGDDEAEIERVEMFPTDNNHATAAPPWTRIEYEVLAAGLELESGSDRYANIASRLDRSLDEIFEKAREFRLTMEDYYQKNQLPVEPWVESIGRDD